MDCILQSRPGGLQERMDRPRDGLVQQLLSPAVVPLCQARWYGHCIWSQRPKTGRFVCNSSRLSVANKQTSLGFELKKGRDMDLTVWLPLMLGLGLVTMGLMFAFVAACARI